jgi:Homeodomain-like domain
VIERRRAVALAHHFREAEGLSIKQIADRLGRSQATVKAYFYDPTGEKARAVKARYVGVCRGWGAYTQPRNGKGDALPVLQALPPRRDRAEVDAGAGDRGDAGLAAQLRESSVLL